MADSERNGNGSRERMIDNGTIETEVGTLQVVSGEQATVGTFSRPMVFADTMRVSWRIHL